MTVSRTLKALNHHVSTGEDYSDAYQAICDEANKPKGGRKPSVRLTVTLSRGSSRARGARLQHQVVQPCFGYGLHVRVATLANTVG